MSRKDTPGEYLRALRRRRDHLTPRLEGPWAGSPQGREATRRERAALSWAVRLLETAQRTGDLEWLEQASALTALEGGDSRQRETGSS